MKVCRRYVVGLLMAGCLGACAPETRNGASEDRSSHLVALGAYLFESPRMSANQKISCATCHHPDRYFSEPRRHSLGVNGTDVGANSATLIGLANRTAFPPSPMVSGAQVTVLAGDAMTLEDRCLAPILNPVEMGSSLEAASAAIGADGNARVLFRAAFGDGAISRKRIGEALAAFVRSIEPPPSSYREFLEGRTEALTPVERRGLAVFEGRGQCAGCHAGATLTDGKMHVVLLPESRRARVRPRKQRARFGYGGGSDFITPTLTPTLWAITRTSPYFRDGTVSELDAAVRDHVRELREVAGVEPCAPRGREPAFLEISPPGSLQPTRPAPPPERLGSGEFAELLAFLATLSPRSR
ncbi:MAG: hypothetical protein CMJ83_09365 [Planctomycetes bacterium]|nr:hypothetical protein [Planctomycetota bacterium]